MNFINLDYIKNIFPNVKYAFRSEYIFKTSRIKLLNKNEKPTIDTILVCDDIDDWHKDNYKRNKSHYPLIARYTSVKLVTYFQRKGAKIHFNTFADHDQNLQRYGVVSMKDFEDDLKHWKTLTVSSYMHKPYTIIVDSEQFVPFEKKNLLSALCVSALLHLNEGNSPIIVNEKDFYDKIIKIPFIKGSYFKLFDDKMIEFDVEELIDEFRELYLPSMEDIPNKYIKFLRNESEEFGKFVIENSKEAKMFLIDNLPKEVIREMSLIGSGMIRP